MMQDAFEMTEDAGTVANAEELYDGILGEIGLEYSVGQAAVPKSKIAVKEEAKEEVVDDIEARLAALRM
jgi:hypothetical protein